MLIYNSVGHQLRQHYPDRLNADVVMTRSFLTLCSGEECLVH
jgi:hypothetical protein